MGTSAVDFLEDEVLPRLFDRLDSAFPEFGWKRTTRGWTATDRETTKRLTGARPGRVVCNAPMGFLVHGGESVLWTAYVNGGTVPRGEAYVDAVKDLAGRAGVDASVLERKATPEELARREARQARLSVLETFFLHAHEALVSSPAGEKARVYLTKDRGFREDELEDLPLGLYTDPETVKDALTRRGLAVEDIRSAGLLPPAFGDGTTKWTGRLVGELRDRRGFLENVWARTLVEGEEPKYLYLAGAPKTDLGAFGLHEALRTGAGRKDLLLVEGVLDVVSLPLRGFPGVAAIGGSGREMNAGRWAKLAELRVRRVTLALDNDEAGREGAVAAVEAASRVDGGPEVFVVNPSLLGASKDPDAFVRTHGKDAFLEVLSHARAAGVFLAELALEGVTPASPDKVRREAVDRVLDVVNARRGERAGMDAEDILQRTAETVGYSVDTLAGLAGDHEERRRKEETEKALTAALREAQAATGKKPALEVLRGLTGRLAVLETQTEPEPEPFSEERLWRATGETRAGKLSGWSTLDELEVRFFPGELTLMGARTGHGKTTALVGLFLNFLKRAEEDELFVFYTMEEPEVRIYHRLLSALTAEKAAGGDAWTRAAIRAWASDRTAFREYPDLRLLDAARARVRELEDHVLVVYRPMWDVQKVAAHALALKERGARVGAVLVDYVQKVPAPAGLKADRRDIEVTAVARRLKNLAVELGAPVISGAQVNRDNVPKDLAEGVRDAKDYREATATIRKGRPELHNLREGGLEQEADLVLGLLNYAADYSADAKDKRIPDVTLLEVGTLKTREGEPGRWAGLAFAGRYGLLRDIKPHEVDDLRPEKAPSQAAYYKEREAGLNQRSAGQTERERLRLQTKEREAEAAHAKLEAEKEKTRRKELEAAGKATKKKSTEPEG